MPFVRKWDCDCPRIWDKWEAEGKTYVIQDIPPEDDEIALTILLENLCPDEALCKFSGLYEDPESMDSMREFWRESLTQRMSLGCYTELDGKKTLVAINVCVVDIIGEKFPLAAIEGSAWKNVYYAMAMLEEKVDIFKYMNLDKLLHAYGLVVIRELRGARLGARLLMAREPLALHHGVKGTTTVFTGPASQKLAARCGFTTIQEMTVAEAAEAGLNYPKSDHVIKLMVKKYCG